MVWQRLQNEKPLWLGVLGVVILFAYGIILMRQEFASFGKVYAAYGGVFIVMAVLWGWWIDHRRPDVKKCGLVRRFV
uniref:YnfA family protein n=1 Tax=Alicyclobacillus tolerans TaxID=90970 RepID=UPI0027E213C8|nr:YnfA family protein [Alicyclobacillus tolerans]